MIATKVKKQFKCSSCGMIHPKQLGLCRGCAKFNTIEETTLAPKVYKIPKQSEKTKKLLSETKGQVDNENVLKEKWFADVREKLTGYCQCGCGNISQKKDDMFFRSSCCHIFPKSKFHSIKFHRLNFVERAFFGGCHSQLDDRSISNWVNMADWYDIKRKFNILAPLLTEQEKATKFYTQLENLVKNN
jgi:hypothetical protein